MKAEYDSLTTRIKTEESKQTKTLTSLTEEVHFRLTLLFFFDTSHFLMVHFVCSRSYPLLCVVFA